MTIKNFMTSIKTLAALLMAGAAFAACSSSDDEILNDQPIVNPTAPKTYTMTDPVIPVGTTPTAPCSLTRLPVGQNG